MEEHSRNWSVSLMGIPGTSCLVGILAFGSLAAVTTFTGYSQASDFHFAFEDTEIQWGK
jgi:hypothetical protein